MESFEDSGPQFPMSFKEKVGMLIGMILALGCLAGFALVTRAYMGG